ncbi:MAG: hypothetical protein JEY96_01000 [Bacteroidales bacterium]|nr:hypothetical protein [Bacteroidales bacterium]
MSEVSKASLNSYTILINCFIPQTKEILDQAKKISGKNELIAIHVYTLLQECEKSNEKASISKHKLVLLKISKALILCIKNQQI